MRKRNGLILVALAALLLAGCGRERAEIGHGDGAFATDVTGFVQKFNERNPANQLADPVVEGNVHRFALMDELGLILTTGEKGQVSEIRLVYLRGEGEQNAPAAQAFASHAKVIIDLVTVPDYRGDAFEKLQPGWESSSIHYHYDGVSYHKLVEAQGRTLRVFVEKR